MRSTKKESNPFILSRNSLKWSFLTETQIKARTGALDKMDFHGVAGRESLSWSFRCWYNSSIRYFFSLASINGWESGSLEHYRVCSCDENLIDFELMKHAFIKYSQIMHTKWWRARQRNRTQCSNHRNAIAVCLTRMWKTHPHLVQSSIKWGVNKILQRKLKASELPMIPSR